MPRRVQDIVPNNHRSIRDIPVERNDISAPIQPPRKKTSSHTLSLKKSDLDVKKQDRVAPPLTILTEQRRASYTVDEGAEAEKVEPVKHISVTPPHRKKKSGSKKLLFMAMGIVVVVAGAGYVASVYFSRASFTVVAKTIPVAVNGTYITQSTPAKGALTYEIAAVKGSASATVAASDGPSVSTSAKGKITVYNSYSAQPQRLIAGTRFSDDTGRIYRLTGSIVVPGYTTSGGKITPGALSATVVADQPGPTHNITKSDNISDFKIVAYKGTPRYDSVYGRMADDITGGFVGAKKTVSPAVLASTTAQLQSQVIASLSDQIKGTLPEGYIMYRSAYVPVFTPATVGGGDPKSATVTVQGTLYGILFKKEELVARVAGEDAISSFEGFTYDTPGFDELDFSIANQKEFSPVKKNTLIIKLKGDATLVGSIPVETLKGKLAGLSLADTSSVLRAYKPVIQIDRSSGEITPPWSKVPSDPSRISIEVLTK